MVKLSKEEFKELALNARQRAGESWCEGGYDFYVDNYYERDSMHVALACWYGGIELEAGGESNRNIPNQNKIMLLEEEPSSWTKNEVIKAGYGYWDELECGEDNEPEYEFVFNDNFYEDVFWDSEFKLRNIDDLYSDYKKIYERIKEEEDN